MTATHGTLQIIKASAGSGKTYTLALEYITLLLGLRGPDGRYRLHRRHDGYHGHILAVTFTNKATEEMKERIIKELSLLADPATRAQSPYIKELTKRFGESEERMGRAAHDALHELLFNFTTFNVSTIDSFFQVVMRTFAEEINLPHDYCIELNDKSVIEVGVRDFLSQLRYNPDVKNNPVVGWLSSYVRDKINDGSTWNVFSQIGSGGSDLFGFATVINTEQYRDASTAMSTYFTENGGTNMGRLQKLVADKVEALKKTMADHARQVQSIAASHGVESLIVAKGCGPLIDRIAQEKSDLKKSDEVERYYNYMDEPDSYFKKGKKKDEVAAREAAVGEIKPHFEAIMKACGELLLFINIGRHIYMLGLLGDISKSVGQYRLDNNLVLLSDTNELLNRLIDQAEAPFIYERIGVRIRHFLVDEFQDTSALQWRNFKPLLANSLAEGDDNLIIGDEKQCIYRFRNSDPKLLQYRVAQDEDLAGHISQSGDRSTNWRSTPVVIRFNNTFFTYVAGVLGVGDVYSNVVQDINHKERKLRGYVRVERVETVKDGPSFKETVLDRLPDEINAIMDRGYKQSDIAILVNRNDEGAEVIKRLLQYNTQEGAVRKFDVISSDSLLLKNSPAVRLVISHLRYLSVAIEMRKGQTNSRHQLQERLHRLLRLYEDFMSKRGEPSQAMEPWQAMEQAAVALEDENSKKQMLGSIEEFVPIESHSHHLVSVVERIIEKAVPAELLTDEAPFLAALQDYVIDFSQQRSGVASIRAFVAWWDSHCEKLSITSPSGTNAINVMTIHKSKGLEFPCVIIPLANWEMCRLNGTLWFTRQEVEKSGILGDDTSIVPPLLPVKYYAQLADSPLRDAYIAQERESIIDCLNKTYVAFTRAIDELHIFAPAAFDNKTIRVSDYFESSEVKEWRNSDAAGDDDDHFITVESTDTGYQAGEPATNDRAEKQAQQGELINEYEVTGRYVRGSFLLPDVNDPSAARNRGVMLHKIFGMIHSSNDVERTLRRCLKRCVIPAGVFDEVAASVRQMLRQSEQVGSWFAPGNRVYNERTISHDGERYRPDRVIVTPQGQTVVIDFKFGQLHLPQYHQQVKHYMELLAAAGLHRPQGYIWYPQEGIIEEVE